MCKGVEHREFRLSSFFDSFWDTYKKNPNHFITREQYKAVSAMRSCRTESIGIDHYVCADCGELSQVYHSCKNRFCPTCSWKDTMEWASKLQTRMLHIAHRHVVFTLPHMLHDLINRNKPLLLGVLFQTASETLKDWMYHKYGLTPGIISVLHTYGEKKDLHPHVHMIVSWGGVTKDNWIDGIKGDYVNYDFLQTKFRCKFEDKLVDFYNKGHLCHPYKSKIDFLRFIKRINEKQWHLHLEPSMSIPSQVVRYIGRYSKRACLSEHKISNIEGEYITFKYKDYKHLDSEGRPFIKEQRLHYREFFPRLLQHVPPANFRLVRYYGAYSARSYSLLSHRYLCEESALELEPTEDKDHVEHAKYCTHCAKPKMYLYSTFINEKNERIYMTRFKPKPPNEQVA